MSINAYVSSYLPFDYHTETAATHITEEVPGQNGKRLALMGFEFRGPTTAHDISIMHCGSVAGSRNTASVLAISGQKTITCTTAPTDPAGNAAEANDVIAFQLTDGSWEFDIITGIAGSIVTCTNNITGVDGGVGATAIAAGGKVRIFGVVGDGYSYKFTCAIDETLTYDDMLLAQAPYKGDPLWVHIDNTATAGYLNHMLFAYINK